MDSPTCGLGCLSQCLPAELSTGADTQTFNPQPLEAGLGFLARDALGVGLKNTL